MNNLTRNLMYILSKKLNYEDTDFVMDQVDNLLLDYNITPKERNYLPATTSNIDIIAMYLNAKKAQGRADSSLAIYFSKLKSFCKVVQKPVIDVTSDDVRMYLIYAKDTQNRSLRTIDHDRLVLSGFFGWLMRENYISSNPMDSIGSVKYVADKRISLKEKEVERMRYSCRNDIRKTAVMEMLMYTACRNNELTHIKLSDIDWERKIITLFGKGSKKRQVTFDAKTELAMKRYIEKYNPEYYLFYPRGHKDKHLSTDQVREIIHSIHKDANLSRNVTPHDLRHTAANGAIKKGMPILEGLEWLRRENIDTTRIHQHVGR